MLTILHFFVYRSFDDRYQALCQVAKSHSVLSLGLSCFKVIPSRYDADNTFNKKQLRFLVQTFNITLLCDEDYVVEPVALRFLVEHSFDFNKQYSQGVAYYRGLDKVRVVYKCWLFMRIMVENYWPWGGLLFTSDLRASVNSRPGLNFLEGTVTSTIPQIKEQSIFVLYTPVIDDPYRTV